MWIRRSRFSHTQTSLTIYGWPLSMIQSQNGKFNSKLNFYKLIPYLVDRCICPAPCRSRQTLEKNVLSWALAGTGSVLFIRQVAV